MPQKFLEYAHIHNDATAIILIHNMQEFKEFHFGQMSLETLHLSRRKEYGPDGFYKCVQDYTLS